MSDIAITSMNRALGATFKRRFRMPRFALIMANGTRILNMSNAPCENGLKTGMRRWTLSSEKEEIEAILPVEKKADCRRKKKKRASLASDVVKARYVPYSSARQGLSVVVSLVSSLRRLACSYLYKACSRRTQVTTVIQKTK